jgi:Xaa-Pro aminopeptidase
VTPVSDTNRYAPIDHRRRADAVRSWLGSSPYDALLLTDLIDIRWLTGFSGSNGWVVMSKDGFVLGTDGRYADRARAETAGSGVDVVAFSQRAALRQRLLDALRGTSATALDSTSTSHAEWNLLAADISLRPEPSVIGRLRRVKDAAEIQRMQAAAEAADAALAEVEPILFGAVDDDVTEADLRDELEYRMRRHGADDRSYDTIVASGPDHGARPHHEVSRRRLLEGDTVIIDVGALVDGYHSDMTRSYVVGEPTDEQRRIYALVEAAHAAGIAALRSGVSAREVDLACRSLFDAAGCLDWYLHGTGHGVGLLIHESPFHSQASDEIIETGNVVTVEPGLYRVGFGGFRIEDLLVVTETGSQRLTHTVPRPFSG